MQDLHGLLLVAELAEAEAGRQARVLVAHHLDGLRLLAHQLERPHQEVLRHVRLQLR